MSGSYLCSSDIGGSIVNVIPTHFSRSFIFLFFFLFFLSPHHDNPWLKASSVTKGSTRDLIEGWSWSDLDNWQTGLSSLWPSSIIVKNMGDYQLGNSTQPEKNNSNKIYIFVSHIHNPTLLDCVTTWESHNLYNQIRIKHIYIYVYFYICGISF